MQAESSVGPAFVTLLIVGLGALVVVLGAMAVRARRDVRRVQARKEDLKAALAERTASLREAVERAERANHRVQNLERVDGLTGAANQIAFLEAAESEWRRGKRDKAPVAVALVAVDGFGDLDQAFGSTQGDECLRRVGAVLTTGVFRAGDLVGRWGGDRFAILLPATAAEGAAAVARRLSGDLDSVAIPRSGSASGATLSFSAAVAAAVPGKGRVEDLLASAEAALEEAMRRGPRQIVTAPERAEADPRRA